MNDLAIRTTVRELVAAFVASERDVRAAFAQIVTAEDRVNVVFGDGSSMPDIRVTASGDRYHCNFRNPDRAIALMTRAAWRAIVDRLELRRVMSIERWEKLGKQMSEGDLPPITEETVLAFYEQHASRAREMLQEMAREVYDWLRPRPHTRAGKLRTNSQLEVGERVILDSVVERGVGGGFRLQLDHGWGTQLHSARQRFIALENVFNGLAGNGTICKSHQSLLAEAIRTAKDGVGETDLFAFRAHKNGSLHLRFKRLDLLARFNAIAAGKTLRPAETEEERLRREIAHEKAENARLKRQRAA